MGFFFPYSFLVASIFSIKSSNEIPFHTGRSCTISQYQFWGPTQKIFQMSKTDCQGVLKKYFCVTASKLLLCVFLTAQSSWVRSLSQDCLKYEWKSSIWNYESVLQHTRHSSFDIRELTKNCFSWIYVPWTSFHFTMALLRCCQGSLPSRCVGHCRGCAPSWPWGGWSTSKGRLPTKQNSLKCAPVFS